MPNKHPMNKAAYRKKRFYIAFSLIALATFLFVSQKTMYKTSSPQRTISSVSPKMAYLQPQSKLIKHTEKLNLPIFIDLENLDAKAMQPNMPFTLLVTIQSHIAINNYSGEWHIPRDMEILKGTSKINNIELQPGQKKQFEITLKSKLQENEQVHFSFLSKQKDSPYNRTVQYNTLDQEKIEMSKQEILNRNIDYQFNNKKQKVYH